MRQSETGMVFGLTWYSLLEISEGAAPEGIRAAFRRLAKIHHPDANGNTPESAARFRLLREAYDTLSDGARRADYDAWIRSSKAVEAKVGAAPDRTVSRRTVSPSGKALPSYGAIDEIFAHLNYILWDIEDLIGRPLRSRLDDLVGDRTVGDLVLGLLAYLDERVLSPAGFPDYFLTARKLSGNGKAFPVRPNGSHGPYAGVRDYFYVVRRRAGAFMNAKGFSALERPAGPDGLTVLDALFGFQKLAARELGGAREPSS